MSNGNGTAIRVTSSCLLNYRLYEDTNFPSSIVIFIYTLLFLEVNRLMIKLRNGNPTYIIHGTNERVINKVL